MLKDDNRSWQFAFQHDQPFGLLWLLVAIQGGIYNTSFILVMYEDMRVVGHSHVTFKHSTWSLACLILLSAL